MKKAYKILLSILIISFTTILILVKLNKTVKIDSYIYNLLLEIKNYNLTNIVKIITNFGDTFCIVAIILICFIVFKNKLYPKLITLNIIGIVIINQTLKYLIMRPRPDEIMHLVEETGFSFPSGHSMAAFGFYGFFIYLICQSNLNKKIKIILTVILSILIVIIGLSRIYLGVHYFSDVISGFIVSAIYLILFTTFIKKYLKYE